MKTAILYSGQFRTLPQCLPTQQWHVFRHFGDLRFFLVMQKTPDAAGCVKMMEDKYGVENVFAELIDDPKDLPMIPLKHGAHAPYANAASHPQLLMQHWYQQRVHDFWQDVARDVEFDAVIRMRGDNFFHSTAGVTEISEVVPQVRSPWWGRFGGLNDRFAVMNPCAAKSYFRVYESIDTLLAAGCPFHPESLLRWKLELGGVHSDETLLAEFSTHRANGQHRPPEISAVDIGHLAAARSR